MLDRPVNMILGPDESLTTSAEAFARETYDRTVDYWQSWSRSLSIPFEWQDAVIRAAITLKLCQYEGTGAIVAALTTSIPEAPDSGRNWDYRYCWLRDAAFVVRTLNQLGATKSMEDFLGYIYTLASGTDEMQPVYGIHFERALTEQSEPNLAGYRGHGPVRSGNEAYLQKQHDVYGSVVMASTHLFFDQRLTTPGDEGAFEQLERAGDLAYELFDKPDAGLWEFRGRQGVHTYSSVMCWVAADRLAKIALQNGSRDRAAHWRSRADVMRDRILHEAYDEERGAFMETWGGSRLDASTLVLADLGFISADDERFLGTLEAVETHLKRGDYLFRYVDADDFGEPDTSFNLCTFWYLDALARVGRTDEARTLFEQILSRRNHVGLHVRRPAPRNRRALGKLSPDLLDARHHPDRDASVSPVGAMPHESPHRGLQPGRHAARDARGWPGSRHAGRHSPRTAASGSAGPARCPTPPALRLSWTRAASSTSPSISRVTSTTPTTTASPTARCGRCCTTGSISSTTAATPTAGTNASTAHSPGCWPR